MSMVLRILKLKFEFYMNAPNPSLFLKKEKSLKIEQELPSSMRFFSLD